MIIQITSIQRQNIEPVYLRKGKEQTKPEIIQTISTHFLALKSKTVGQIFFVRGYALSQNSPLLSMFEPISRQTSNLQALATTISLYKF